MKTQTIGLNRMLQNRYSDKSKHKRFIGFAQFKIFKNFIHLRVVDDINLNWNSYNYIPKELISIKSLQMEWRISKYYAQKIYKLIKL